MRHEKLAAVVAATLAIAGMATICIRGVNMQYGKRRGLLPSRFELWGVDGRRGSAAQVTIGFRYPESGCILVPATIEGTRTEAQIDTGLAGVHAPRSFNSRPYRLNQPIRLHSTSRPLEPYDCVCIPSIAIGNYSVHDVPAACMTGTRSASGDISGPETVLGCSVFAHVCLTLDFPNRQLVISDGNAVLAPSHKRIAEVPFEWVDGNEGSPGVPVVRGEIEGRAVTVGVDTGLGGLVLSGKLADLLRSRHRSFRKPKTDADEDPVDCLAGISGRIGSARFAGEAMVHDIRGMDAVVGTQLMERYRVTFDISRRRLYLDQP
jgi:hypothetical protein